MPETQNGAGPVIPVEEIQKGWNDLTLRVKQLETEGGALELENKSLRSLLERVVEHRQKSHSELVTLLTSLVAKLPINDIGVVVSRLVEHNAHVTEVSASLAKGRIEEGHLQPAILKLLEKTKRDLTAAVKPAVEELIKLDAPFEAGLLESLIAKPDNFFSPAMVRANRGFVKGQLPRERVVKEFGTEALVLFKDCLLYTSAAYVCVKQIHRLKTFAPHFRVEIHAAGRQTSVFQNRQHRVSRQIDVGRKLVRVPAEQLVARVRVNACLLYTSRCV